MTILVALLPPLALLLMQGLVAAPEDDLDLALRAMGLP